MNITLHNLPSVKKNKSKRVGRGYGSGKGGHTTTRGQKGQKTRSKLPLLFEGSKQRKSLIRRTPFLRGKLRNKPLAVKPLIVNLKDLNALSAGSTVDIEILIRQNIVSAPDARQYGVKILGDGKLEKKLIIKLPTSKSAAKQIVKMGGKIIDKEKPAAVGQKLAPVKEVKKKAIKKPLAKASPKAKKQKQPK